VRPQVFIGPSNDGRRHGRGTYLFTTKNRWTLTYFFWCQEFEKTRLTSLNLTAATNSTNDDEDLPLDELTLAAEEKRSVAAAASAAVTKIKTQGGQVEESLFPSVECVFRLKWLICSTQNLKMDQNITNLFSVFRAFFLP
jgi:hypothetical protein